MDKVGGGGERGKEDGKDDDDGGGEEKEGGGKERGTWDPRPCSVIISAGPNWHLKCFQNCQFPM